MKHEEQEGKEEDVAAIDGEHLQRWREPKFHYGLHFVKFCHLRAVASCCTLAALAPTLIHLAMDCYAALVFVIRVLQRCDGEDNVVLAGYHRSFGHRPERTFKCMVFDSATGKWRKFVSLQDDHFTHMNRNQVVFANGALHWLTASCSCLLVLDLDCESWRKIPLPGQVVCGSGNRVYLLESADLGCVDEYMGDGGVREGGVVVGG
ncbi:hypothetical protein SASPL_101888 [Salvia splendens]|uniref:Uncharacterized protein n=1 Tax=Salvia splendens TaxID=180675 RepID=A0A8X8YVC7_SALSN|nr:hypothetical protein SASPL_101888 [Salvia splendens]